jgi:hypothetical protein
VDDAWMPPLLLSEDGSRCRLWLGSWLHGEGETLQDAADDLIEQVAVVGRSFRLHGLPQASVTGTADHRWMEFFSHVGEMVERGEDIRDVVVGLAPATPGGPNRRR